jgi:uncharacterized protein
MRRYLEARGVVGRIDRPHVTARLLTTDGVALEGSYLTGSGTGDIAVLLAHGFAANRRKPAYARLASALAEQAPVLTIDLRGHGGSAGACTLGDREARDVEAALHWLRGVGHDRVVALGVSMGATAVLHAVAAGAVVDGMITVSAPGWFRDPPDTVPLQRLHDVWSSPVRRRALRVGLGVRLEGPEGWSSPPHPVEMLEGVSVPYLAVHGHDDAYFPASDGAALVAAAGDAALGWLEPAGFGHAEDGFSPAFNRRLSAAIATWQTTGAFPTREASLAM